MVTIDEAYRQIAHNIHLLVHNKLTDESWRGGVRRRAISEIRELTGGIEADRPTTHLAYRAAEPGQHPAEFHPSPGLLADLAPFHSAWGRS